MMDRDALRAAYAELASLSDAGVPGTNLIDSGRPGPTLGVTVMTHGNEPAGLAAWFNLTRVAPPVMRCGRVIWVLNNLRAAAAYFSLPADAEQLQVQSTRLCDRNMNRLPRDLHGADKTLYEVRRSLDLLPVWSLFDYGMDIHTTSQNAPPILGGENGLDAALFKGMPISLVIDGLGAQMRDRQVCAYFGKSDRRAPTLLLEAGGHEVVESQTVAASTVKRFMANLGMIDPILGWPVRRAMYTVRDSVFFPDFSYQVVKVFPNFVAIACNTVLAIGNGAPLTARWDGHVLFCPASRRLTDLEEEAVFLSAPLRYVAG